MAVTERPLKISEMREILRSGKWILTLRGRNNKAKFLHVTRDTSLIPEEKMGRYKDKNQEGSLHCYNVKDDKWEEIDYNKVYGYEALIQGD